MAGPIRVLHIDDDEAFARLTADAIERNRERFDVVTARHPEEVLERVRSEDTAVDCVVADYEMPGMDGLELLREIRGSRPRLPYILFTGAGSEGIASEAISAGVTDYMEKATAVEQYELLANRIENAVEQHRDVERRAEAMATSMDGMAILDDDGEYIYVNEAHASVYGYDDPEAMVGEHWHVCYEGEELQRFESEVVPLLFDRGEWRGEAVGVRANGTTFPQEVSLTAMDDGGIVCVVRDITERRERERELARRRQALERVYEVIAEPDQQFEAKMGDLLEAVRSTIGTDLATFSQVRGDEYVFEAVAGADETLTAGDVMPLSDVPFCERVVESEGSLVVEDVEAEAPELAGGRFGISCYLGAPVTVEGDVYGTFCFYDGEAEAAEFSDWMVAFVELLSNWVSAEYTRRRTRRRLERQNERLAEFAAVVSHDLRNPLGTLVGSLELAEETGDPEHFRRCESVLETMEARIEGLLSLARAGEHIDETEPVSVSDLAADCWATVPTGGGSLEVETGLTVQADAERLRQLFENLFRNAVEHGSTSPQQAGDAVEHGSTDSQNAARSGDAVEHGSEDAADAGVTVTVDAFEGGFYVADDGRGIPEDEREAVFDFGYTTAEDGTGLGLAIVDQVATAHGWDVAVAESEAGGARFEFHLDG